jgi:hypothetical protein
MDVLKRFAATPFSDLWLPVIVCGLVLILLLGLHWLWLNWRLRRFSLQPQRTVSEDKAGEQTSPLAPPIEGVLSDIYAFTAQKQPITLEERHIQEAPYIPSARLVSERLDPTFSGFEAVDESIVGFNPPVPPQALNAERLIDNPTEQEIFFKPHSTVVFAKAHTPEAPTAHLVFHYQARLSWGDAQGKYVLGNALQSHPWTHSLPVIWTPDSNDECSVIAAWQVVSRRELANQQDCEHFKQWVNLLATLSAARCEMLSAEPWDTVLDKAHSLLIGLDSVIVLKVAVPVVQVDLFAQSLLAARFSQVQEHWLYQEQGDSAPIWLERLWQNNSDAQTAVNQQAIYQLILDIPHLDSLEARKIYMRLRAVVRTSAAIVQSAQGAHLSEGMLDRYSRELMMKQDALVQAQVVPGSVLAQQLFKPQLSLSQDLSV